MNEKLAPSFVTVMLCTSSALEGLRTKKGSADPHEVVLEFEEELNDWVLLPVVMENGPPCGGITHLIETPEPLYLKDKDAFI